MTSLASQLVFFRHPNFYEAFPDPNKESFNTCLSELKELKEAYPVSTKKTIYEKIQHENADKGYWDLANRQSFEEEFRSFFQVVEKKFDLSGKNILEVGSGMLLYGESYLSIVFPHSNFTFSDKEAVVKNNAEWCRNYIPIDLLGMVSKTSRQFEFVMASNVFDGLAWDTFPKAFQRISKHLNDKGTFFHFTTVEFFKDAFFDICAREKPNCTLLPSNYKNKRIYRIDKERVRVILNEKHQLLSPDEVKFFTEWNESDPQTQACTISNIYKKKLIEDFNLFENRCVEIFSSDLESINAEDLFKSRMEKAAQENGFNVAACEYYQSETQTPSPDNTKISLKAGVRHYEKLPSNWVWKNKLTKAVQVHMFIARKKPLKPPIKSNFFIPFLK